MSNSNRLHRIFVPRFMDAANTNAQNLNAKALLSRFSSSTAHWQTVHYDPVDPSVMQSSISINKLWRKHLWMPHLAALYQQDVTAIFYPGFTKFDVLGIRIRALTGRKIPVISTIEGLISYKAEDSRLAAAAGHAVFSQCVDEDVYRRGQWILQSSAHIIAISPFLARIARELFGNKVSCLPLGIDSSIFHVGERRTALRPRIVTTGHISPRKRPDLFVEAAVQNRSAEFVWLGGGAQLEHYRHIVRERGIANLSFAGSKSPQEVADELRRSSIFAICSLSEGAPKSLQEAAACGLPLVAFGFYEPPSIVHNENGFLSWNDEEFLTYVKALIEDAAMAQRMGSRSAEMAREWDWDIIASRWEQSLLGTIREFSPGEL